MLTRIYIVLIALGISFSSYGQHHQVGVLYGYGGPNYLGVDYSYKVQLIQVQYIYAFKPMTNWGCEVFGIPQFNFTEFRERNHHHHTIDGFEFGINFGVLMRRNWNETVSTYVGLSLGPHYISGAPTRQVSGFIFSDNFFFGLSSRLFDNVFLDVRTGFRHISNADFAKPNKGINSLILNAGLFVELDQ